jgi:hypothetical protein
LDVVAVVNVATPTAVKSEDPRSIYVPSKDPQQQ